MNFELFCRFFNLRKSFELNKKYGFYKFIILTPSIAIKEGTKNFIRADYSKQHFRTKYGKEISLNIINSGSFEGKKNKIKLLTIKKYFVKIKLV